MKINQIFLLSIALILSINPVSALTWKELLNAIKIQKYDFPANAKNKHVSCWKKVYWEEYVEGDSYNVGYVKKFDKDVAPVFTEFIKLLAIAVSPLLKALASEPPLAPNSAPLY